MRDVVLSAALGAALSSAALADWRLTVVPIWLEGQNAPGGAGAFVRFDRPALANGPHAAVTALVDAPIGFDEVVVRDQQLVARAGDPAAGTEGVFDAFDPFDAGHAAGGLGDVGYVATLRDVVAGFRAVYRGATLVAREGDVAPGAPDRHYRDFDFVGVDDLGRCGFHALLDGASGSDSAIVRDAAILYREGDPVPGRPEAHWDGNFDELAWNARGELVFEGNTSHPAATDHVVFRRLERDSGAIEEIVLREGDAIAAHGGPDALDSVLQLAIGSGGAWAVRGTLAFAPLTEASFVLSGDGMLAQEGDAIAAIPGARLGEPSAIAVDAAGRLAYLADIDDAPDPAVDEGVFIDGALVLATGDPVPGMPVGTVFTDFGFEDLAFDDADHLVLAATFGGAQSGGGVFMLELHPPCRTDRDGDGLVGLADVATVLAEWGACPPTGECGSDLDGDGGVGFSDLVEVLSAWGPCPD